MAFKVKAPHQSQPLFVIPSFQPPRTQPSFCYGPTLAFQFIRLLLFLRRTYLAESSIWKEVLLCCEVLTARVPEKPRVSRRDVAAELPLLCPSLCQIQWMITGRKHYTQDTFMIQSLRKVFLLRGCTPRHHLCGVLGLSQSSPVQHDQHGAPQVLLDTGEAAAGEAREGPPGLRGFKAKAACRSYGGEAAAHDQQQTSPSGSS